MSLGKCSCCGKDAISTFPLLAGSPSFCNSHHNQRDAGPFGCDLGGPEDFDIPLFNTEEDFPLMSSPEGSYSVILQRSKFVWRDVNGKKHKLKNIGDQYLYNIINFLKRKESSATLRRVIAFLEGEYKSRKWVERNKLKGGGRCFVLIV